MAVHQPTDHRVEEDDERGSEGGQEEVGLAALRVPFGRIAARKADEIQQQQGGQSHGRVQLGPFEMLQGVDDDPIRVITRVESRDAHQVRNLAHGDVDGRSRHESGYGGQ